MGWEEWPPTQRWSQWGSLGTIDRGTCALVSWSREIIASVALTVGKGKRSVEQEGHSDFDGFFCNAGAAAAAGLSAALSQNKKSHRTFLPTNVTKRQ